MNCLPALFAAFRPGAISQRLKTLALLCLLVGSWGVADFRQAALADCQPQVAGVLMGTPLSSRLDHVGDAVQGVLEHPLQLGSDLILPSGTILKGRVTGVKRGETTGGPPGRLQLQMFKVSSPQTGTLLIQAKPITEGGWLRQQDANTPVWQVSLQHSTRLLNDMIQRRIGTDMAVWASILGVTENVIPDVTSDEFIERYHRNNLLVGAGDRIYMRFICPQSDGYSEKGY